MTYKLVLLRHGQSAWNKTNQFTGWVDVPLTEQGEAEAKRGGELLKEKNVLPDIVFTSLLRRAINTANIALDAADRLWIPVQRDWRLNERHYGALQGKNKTEIREEYGDEKFMLWRRSYATPPPEIDPNDQYAQNNDPRYAGDPVPEAECLANVVERVKPYFESAIEPELKAGKTVLIAAHGNSLRAIVKMLDNLSEEEIAKVNIPTAIPLLYELDENFKPIKPRGEYLDPEAAAAGAAAVARIAPLDGRGSGRVPRPGARPHGARDGVRGRARPYRVRARLHAARFRRAVQRLRRRDVRLAADARAEQLLAPSQQGDRLQPPVLLRQQRPSGRGRAHCAAQREAGGRGADAR